MRTVTSYEAKTHLPRLLREVAAGTSITITRHGHPVARLVPASAAPTLSPAEAIEALRAFRQDRILGDTTLRDLIDEGRR
jgi:prevent-host-death family protein